MISHHLSFYRFGHHFFSFAVRQFFRSIRYEGVEIPTEGPIIIAGNHPNMMMDALLIVKSSPRDLYFLAKSTLFSNPLISQLLTLAHLLPVYRKMDGADTRANERTFEVVAKKLQEGEAMVIFPEGTSVGGRKLLTLKTGAARMALEAEAASGFTLGIKILPMGITYAEPIRFQSSVTLQGGEPIVLQDFAHAYKEDPAKAVRDVTHLLDQRLRALTVEVTEERFEELVTHIGKLYRATENDFTRLRTIARNVATLAPLYPDKTLEIEARLKELTLVTEKHSIPEGFLRSLLFFGVSLGIALFYLPYRFIGVLARWASPSEVELGSNKLVFGILLYVIWYLFLILLFAILTHSLGWTLLVIFGIPLLGMLVNRWSTWWTYEVLSLLVPSQVRSQELLRAELIAELEALRVE